MAGTQAYDNGGGMPSVSIIIPTYGRARLLGEAIESVLEQRYPRLRLIVSDNRSTDGTAARVARYNDARLTYLLQPEHLELNAHFNRCIELGLDADYLVLLPDDDLLLPGMVERAVATLERHRNLAFVHGAARIIDADGRLIEPVHDMTRTLEGDALEAGEDFVRESMRGGYRVHGSTTVFRTAALAGHQFDLRDYPAADFGLVLRLALVGDVGFLAEPLAAYRVHGGTYTGQAGAVATTRGYVQGTRTIAAIRAAKLRFLAEHPSRFPDARRLRRQARRAMRRDLVDRANGLSMPERSPLRVGRLLAAGLRLDPLLALEPAAWRLLAASLLGPRIVASVRARRARRAGLGELPA